MTLQATCRQHVEFLNQRRAGKHAAAGIQQCLCNWPRQMRLAAGIVWEHVEHAVLRSPESDREPRGRCGFRPNHRESRAQDVFCQGVVAGLDFQPDKQTFSDHETPPSVVDRRGVRRARSPSTANRPAAPRNGASIPLTGSKGILVDTFPPDEVANLHATTPKRLSCFCPS
jgi:hypothetical protein